MFKDKVRVKFIAGRGGDGKVSFDTHNHKSNGGNGGKGGSVYLQADTNEFDFRNFKSGQNFKAQSGHHGGKSSSTGADGKDIIVKLPPTTIVKDIYTGQILAEVGSTYNPKMDEENRIMIAQGGRGGLGNEYFKGRGPENLRTHTKGKQGESLEVELELELESDFILIGYPNAGKSSLLKTLTNAEAKVAPYEFTTLNPQQGQMGDITLLDLPGLIEGTAEGRGLGTRFTRHTRRTQAVAHCLPLSKEVTADDLVEKYKSMREILTKIDEESGSKITELPELILLTKADELDSEDRDKKIMKYEKTMAKYSDFVASVSIIDDDSVGQLPDFLRDFLRVKTQDKQD